jgi:hypothetical protein
MWIEFARPEVCLAPDIQFARLRALNSFLALQRQAGGVVTG